MLHSLLLNHTQTCANHIQAHRTLLDGALQTTTFTDTTFVQIASTTADRIYAAECRLARWCKEVLDLQVFTAYTSRSLALGWQFAVLGCPSCNEARHWLHQHICELSQVMKTSDDQLHQVMAPSTAVCHFCRVRWSDLKKCLHVVQL